MSAAPQRAVFIFGLPSLLLGAAALPHHPLLRYSVDLESPPSKRYVHVWADFLKRRGPAAFEQTYRSWQIWLSREFPHLFGTPMLASQSQSSWLVALRAAHPQAADEVVGLSTALLGTNASEPLFQPAALATLTSLYPILNIAARNTTDTRPSACTSILVRQESGKVLHGRSLDYEPRDPMALGTVVLDFQLRRSTAYSCLHPLLYPTALQWFTCVRPGAFSLSVNARSQGRDNEHNTTFPELLRRVASPGVLLLGEAAERAMQEKTYAGALQVLSSVPVVSSNYYVLAGAWGQGAVVTRFGNLSSADTWALGSAAGWSDGQPPWARVQTNVDHWVPLESGAYATHRRQRAVDALAGMGQGEVSKSSLFSMYLTDHARAGSENRTSPEDTGVILRPSTIATLVMDPAGSAPAEPDTEFWRVWAESPVIKPPAKLQRAVRAEGDHPHALVV
eukprot:CAMPEP_0204563442 /NCGR_PEP_ID=MMETSP0661-20131031/34311_1 /ASSEMBLY_ACC=CAM_ASM_000606 /TAXON_ID=109239 /ORGANISM="Alexandrium margalefi, Strain AMGDE01CS-322" /LENGTH=449 /DNA_ID=CAMNT_0051570997 /DNA_START=51 /DNA_END=1400 /DNA_ORIENTATION=+